MRFLESRIVVSWVRIPAEASRNAHLVDVHMASSVVRNHVVHAVKHVFASRIKDGSFLSVHARRGKCVIDILSQLFIADFELHLMPHVLATHAVLDVLLTKVEVGLALDPAHGARSELALRTMMAIPAEQEIPSTLCAFRNGATNFLETFPDRIEEPSEASFVDRRGGFFGFGWGGRFAEFTIELSGFALLRQVFTQGLCHNRFVAVFIVHCFRTLARL